MDLRSLADENRSRLTPADLRVLEVLLSHPTEAAFLRAEEVADRAGVHQAATTRLAQRLGFDGYPELRTHLQGRLLGAIGPGERVRQSLQHVDGGSLLESLVREESAALHELTRHVTQDQLDDVATRLTSARRVFLFGHGNATVLVDLMDRRLRRFGVDSVALTGSGRDVGERLLGLTGDDTVLAFAFRRSPTVLEPLLGYARERGAASVVVTDVLAGLEPPPSVVLSAPRGNGREYQSLTVPMAIANALVLTIARREPDSSLSSLDRLGSLLERFDI